MAKDMGALEEPVDVRLPEEDDEKDPYASVMKSRVVALDRLKWSEEDANARFTHLQAKHAWRQIGEPFYTARYWCWRIAC